MRLQLFWTRVWTNGQSRCGVRMDPLFSGFRLLAHRTATQPLHPIAQALAHIMSAHKQAHTKAYAGVRPLEFDMLPPTPLKLETASHDPGLQMHYDDYPKCNSINLFRRTVLNIIWTSADASFWARPGGSTIGLLVVGPGYMGMPASQDVPPGGLDLND